jgi:hypothetical protein
MKAKNGVVIFMYYQGKMPGCTDAFEKNPSMNLAPCWSYLSCYPCELRYCKKFVKLWNRGPVNFCRDVQIFIAKNYARKVPTKKQLCKRGKKPSSKILNFIVTRQNPSSFN